MRQVVIAVQGLSCVVSENEVKEQLPEVEQATVEAIADVDTIIIANIFSGLVEQHAKEDGE